MDENSGNTYPTAEVAAVGGGASEPAPTQESVGFEHLHRADELVQEYLLAADEPTIPTGFLSLDKWLMGGLRRKMIYVIAGRPGEGKSSLALSMARRMVIEAPVRVIYLSLEMTKRELIERLICQATLQPIARLNQLRVEGQLAETLRMTVKELAGKWLHLEDARGATIEDLEAFWEQMREAGGETPDVLIIDHLQQVPMVYGITRADALSNYMSDLKRFAKQKNVAVILCCQINRQGTEKPGLLNLKGCVHGSMLVSGLRMRDIVKKKIPLRVKCVDITTGQIHWLKPSRYILSGLKTCIEVRTASGKRLIASDETKVYTQSGWKRVDHLSVGEKIVIEERADASKPEKKVKLSFDTIVKIDPMGKRQCYDFEVPTHHNFFANEILVHNSGGIEEVADVVLIGHRPSFDSAKTTEDLSADMEYDLYICKQRRGPEYKINLLFRAPCFEFLEPTGYGAPRHPALETRVIGRDETPF